LSEAQRETVLLVCGQAYTNAEAAALLGIPIGKPARRSAFELGDLKQGHFLLG
jgi:DNA-directed RNA polymerase specialized sigma24 family protein